MSHIIILEGPSGAGKTTLARKLQAEGYRLVRNENFPRPRDYDYSQPETLMPICRDLWHLYEAVFSDRWPEDQIVIDRWMLSSFVYHKIRQPTELAKGDSYLHQEAYEFMGEWLLAFDSMVKIASDLKKADDRERYGDRALFVQRGRGVPEIQVRLLLPSHQLLEERRAKGESEGIQYPYNAVDELRLFRIMGIAMDNLFGRAPFHRTFRLRGITEMMEAPDASIL